MGDREFMVLKFDESIRRRVPKKHLPLLFKFEEITKKMHEQSKNKFIWSPPNDPRLLLNHYLDILWSVHVSKFSELCRALIDTVNRQEYIIYGLTGRSLIEHAAVMRYYFRYRIQSTVNEAVKTGIVTVEQIKTIVNELDRFLRGSRFDWEAFLTGKFDTLFSDRDDISTHKQINVLTCVQKMGKGHSSGVGPL
ncbi:hypothetical protein ACFLT2_11595 [Acidobacteriota bacterium]